MQEEDIKKIREIKEKQFFSMLPPATATAADDITQIK